MFCISAFSEHVVCKISIFVCKQVKRVLNYYYTEFHETLASGSVEISAFPLNRAVTIFWLTARALHLAGFLIFLDPYKQFQKGSVFSDSIAFNILKNKRFSHITNGNERNRSESSQLFLDVTTILPPLYLLFSVYQWVIRRRMWLHDRERHH